VSERFSAAVVVVLSKHGSIVWKLLKAWLKKTQIRGQERLIADGARLAGVSSGLKQPTEASMPKRCEEGMSAQWDLIPGAMWYAVDGDCEPGA
jgi:hypothetical protein